jgi:spore coat polysaccharide biosynthesis protein SpsF
VIHSVGIIVQARMGSVRLPGKVLMPVGGRLLLEHIIARMTLLHEQTKLVIATSTLPENDAVEQFCYARGVACFRGEEGNVLKRYVDCANHYGFEHVVRLTGDNPFPDAAEVQRLIKLHCQEQADFTTSFEELPIGVGCELFTFQSLRWSLEKSFAPHHFEHVDEYLLENLAQVKHAQLHATPAKHAPDVRLTIDTPEDLACARSIVAQGGDDVTTEEAIRLWRHR